MSKPKWQRARIVSREPLLRRRELWVDNQIYDGPSVETDMQAKPIGTPTIARGLRSNVTDDRRARFLIELERIELLARDENDFADDVPLIPWEQWLKESAPEKTS